MRFFDKLGEFLYANTSSELEDNARLHEEVGAGQQALADQRYADGRLGFFDYISLSGDIKDAAGMTRRYQQDTGGVPNLLSGIPWWVWAALIVAVFWYLGGFFWLKGILARDK